jgi:type I restriction enzyme R subunit
MTPEQKARLDIDNLLTKAGWVIQDMNVINLGAGIAVAVREWKMKI